MNVVIAVVKLFGVLQEMFSFSFGFVVFFHALKKCVKNVCVFSVFQDLVVGTVRPLVWTSMMSWLKSLIAPLWAKRGPMVSMLFKFVLLYSQIMYNLILNAA